MATSKLQQELKKRRAFDSSEQEAALNLIRTADQIENRLGRLLREFGLTMSQYNVLRILRGEGAPLPSLEIADRMIRVVPAITGLIDRLEKQGLVTRRRCEEDRRVVYVTISDKASKLLGKIDEPLQKLHCDLLRHLSRKDLKELSRLAEQARSSGE
jgi:MarR family 2-MHQ and catechol resistance regulon transcriptional repressor